MSHLQACYGFKPKIFDTSHPQSWCFTVLVEAHDRLGHEGGNRTYHLSNVNITGKA